MPDALTPPAPTSGRPSRWLFGLLVGVVFMVLAFWGVPFGEFLAAVMTLHPAWLLVIAAIFTVQESLRAWRQVILLRPLAPDLGVMDSLTIIFVAYFCIHAFPARLGEIVRPVMIHRLTGVDSSAAVGMVVAERVVDLVAALGMLLFVLLAAPTDLVLAIGDRQIDLAQVGQTFGLALVAPTFVGLLVVVLLGDPALLLLGRWVSILPPATRGLGDRLLAVATSFVQGFAALRQAGHLLTVLALTAAIWTTVGFTYWVLAQGFHIGEQIGAVQSMGVMVITLLASVLPAPPGMAGVQEASGRAALALFGVSGAGLDAVALAYAVVVHWWQVIIQAIGAVWFFRRAGVGVRQMAREASAAEPDTP